MVRNLLLFLFFCSTSTLCAQIGGANSFEFLHLPINARQTALGGINISSYGNDVNTFISNPALLTDTTDLNLSLNYIGYYADVNHTSLAFSNTLGKTGTWGFGLQYLNYGDFESYDPTGVPLGNFRARDYVFVIGHSHSVRAFSLGMNLKLAFSEIESYRASGLLFDIGGAFRHPTKDLTVALAFKNVGFSLSNYLSTQSFEMPLDVQIGASFKPKNMPLRLSLTAHHLHQFDIAYDDPTQQGQTDAFGQEIDESVTFADKLARHFIIGGEFVFSKNLQARFGYNFLHRRELQIENRKGMAGFSFGAMLRLRQLELAFSRQILHIVGGITNLTVTIHTKNLIRKKKTIL